jgi:predicted DNA-binding transcriptional regulator YafY
MANNRLNRYAWLIDVIRRLDYMALTDISDLWERSALNDTGEPLPERTFHNHRKSILEIFGIEIRFNKARGYYIAGSDELSSEMNDWLLTSLSVSAAVNECKDLKDRIFFAEMPSGKRYLTDIINAMKENKMIEVIHQAFGSPGPNEYLLSPYCLKAYNNRWYVLAMDNRKGRLKNYALDRISEVRMTQKTFTIPNDFDVADYYKGYLGVYRDETPVQTIRMKVWGKQRDYFNTLPLNDTMREAESYEEWSIFECEIAPTWEVEMELLQYNDMVEVLEPICLREKMIEHAWNMIHLYNEDHLAKKSPK